MLFLIAGTYDGALDNSGERIRLEDATGEMVLDSSYDPAWLPPANDGGQRSVRRLGERLVEPVLFAEAEDQVGQEADDAFDQQRGVAVPRVEAGRGKIRRLSAVTAGAT